MRILHVVDRWNPGGIGGVHVYVRRLAAHPALAAAGCQVEVLCQRCRGEPGTFYFEDLPIHQLEGNHLELLTSEFEQASVGLPNAARDALARSSFPPDAVRENVRLLTEEFAAFLQTHPVDLIHVHNSYVVFPQVLWHNRRMLAERRIPVLFSVHSAPFHVRLDEHTKVHLYHYLAECGDVFDVIHAVSRTVQDRLAADAGVASELMYIGTDTRLFRPAAKDPALLRRCGLTPGDRVVLYAGRLTAEKGLDEFVTTVRALREVGLPVVGLIIGDGPYRARLAGLLDEPGCRDALRLLPPIPYAELPAYYNLADAFLFLTRREALGLVLLEAMACGKVCIASDLPAIHEVITDGEDGLLVAPGNADQAAARLQALLAASGAERAAALAANARRSVVDRFSFNRHAEDVLALYRRLRKEKGS